MSLLQNTEIDFLSIAPYVLLAIVVLFFGRWLAGPLKRVELTESLITLLVALAYYFTYEKIMENVRFSRITPQL